MDAIVAVYSDWGIGSEGTQPIVVPEDRRHFAKLTSGSTVIVGRRTMEDFPGGKPLKDRVNLVITRQDSDIEGAQVVHTLQEAIDASQNAEKVFVLGGGVSAAGQLIIDRAAEAFRCYALPAAEGTRLVLARLGNDAGICGAARLVLDR